MAECWETLSLNRNLDTLTESSFSSYKSQLVRYSDVQLESTKEDGVVRKRELNHVTPPSKRIRGDQANGAAAAVESVDSEQRRISLSPAPLSKAEAEKANRPKYEERLNAGKVVITYNPNNLKDAARSASGRQCEVSTSTFSSNLKEPYRHLFTTLDDRAKVLNEQLDEMTQHLIALLESEQNEESEEFILEGVGIPRQDAVWCIGRICNVAHEGRLLASSIALEGSKDTVGGARVDLDISKVPHGVSLVPGQIVAVYGMNPTGRKMVAQRIVEGAKLDPVQSMPRELLRFHQEMQNGQPLKVMSVCGPYTSSDNSDYQPLLDLFHTVNEEQPDVVIICGPFVDIRHPAVRAGRTLLEFENGEQVPVPYETFFANKVAGLLEDFFVDQEDALTQFVLVPSLEDAMCEAV